MNDYYVYGLFYGDDICFYIGKGTGYRLNEHLYEYERTEVENEHKRRKIKKLRRNGRDPYLYGISRSYCYRLADRKKRKSVKGKLKPSKEVVERIMERQKD